MPFKRRKRGGEGEVGQVVSLGDLCIKRVQDRIAAVLLAKSLESAIFHP